MKLPLLLTVVILTSAVPAPADDLFVADGRRKNSKHTFLYKGEALANVQLGELGSNNTVLVQYRGGALYAAVTDLPVEWAAKVRERAAAKKGEILLPGGATAALPVNNPPVSEDLFLDNGRKKNGKYSFRWRGELRKNVQIGRRTDDMVSIQGDGGSTSVPITDLPEDWVKALIARSQGRPIVPEKTFYDVKVERALAGATARPVEPVHLPGEVKADGSMFSGLLHAVKAGELLIGDRKEVSWVPDAWFKDGAAVRAKINETNSPEMHTIARGKEAEAAWVKVRAEWPEKLSRREMEHRKIMRAWDKLHPVPGAPVSAQN